MLDLALLVAVGGDCLVDVAMLRAERDVFGQVASDSMVCWLIDTLATGRTRVLTVIHKARAHARETVWAVGQRRGSGSRRAGDHGPAATNPNSRIGPPKIRGTVTKDRD
ncbi:hypothetical protein [Streptomyces sp. NPDC127118]|uniref:hypothetical protein n=1 Tax=Streptomyces sp. NPDC127118 TaxID=3345369 RepID=UPI00363A8640